MFDMRWRGRRESSNVEDRRGISPKGIVGGGYRNDSNCSRGVAFGRRSTLVIQIISFCF